jgi:Flp pilus assembly protein TadG
MTRRPIRRRPREAGNAVIELAFTLPLLLAIVTAIFDFGLMFQKFEVLTNAAREGARIGVLPGYTADDAEARALEYLASGGITTATADAQPTTLTYGSPPTTSGGITVTVEQDHQFLWIGPILNLLGGNLGTVTLRAVSTMRAEAS